MKHKAAAKLRHQVWLAKHCPHLLETTTEIVPSVRGRTQFLASIDDAMELPTTELADVTAAADGVAAPPVDLDALQRDIEQAATPAAEPPATAEQPWDDEEHPDSEFEPLPTAPTQPVPPPTAEPTAGEG